MLDDTLHSQSDLIEQIYRIALSPEEYDAFLARWNAYLSVMAEEQGIPDGTMDPVAIDNRILRHCDAGLQLLDQLGRGRPSAPLSELSASSAIPTILIDRQGSVVWFNGTANRHFRLSLQAKANQLPVMDRSRGQLDELIALLGHVTRPTAHKAILCMQSALRKEAVFMLSQIIIDKSGQPILLIKQISDVWQRQINQLLSQTFGLTDSEVDIVELMHAGLPASAIAKERGRSLNTVRTQIKSILSKTGTGSQTDLLRLIVPLNQIVSPLADMKKSKACLHPDVFWTSRGRLLRFHQFGPNDGKPVLSLHGMLLGSAPTPHLMALAEKHHLRIIAPERPGYGETAPDDGPVAKIPDLYAKDLRDLLDHLAIEKAIAMGHGTGILPALVLASVIPERISAVASIAGHIPLTSPDQIAAMSPRMQQLATIAKRARALLPFILRAGIRHIDLGGEEAFLAALAVGSKADQAALQDLTLLEHLSDGLQNATTQSHEFLQSELQQTLTDWSHRFAHCQAPVHLFHGEQDPITSIDFVKALAEKEPTITSLTILPEAGQHLFLSDPEAVLGTIAQIPL